MEISIPQLSELAEALGIATKTLVAWYAARVWTTVIPVINTLVFGLLVPGLGWRYIVLPGYKRAHAQKDRHTGDLDDPRAIWVILTILALVAGVFSAVILPATIDTAITALASPEAYAVDQILRRLR